MVGNMEDIGINTLSPQCDLRFDYRSTKKNQNELISIKTLRKGVYQVEGKGIGLEIGDTLRVSLKGSKSLSLALVITELRYLIEPNDQWLAQLEGEAFEELQIYTWKVVCDRCEVVSPLEFVSRLGDDDQTKAQHATSRLKALMWGVCEGKHVCPECEH